MPHPIRRQRPAVIARREEAPSIPAAPPSPPPVEQNASEPKPADTVRQSASAPAPEQARAAVPEPPAAAPVSPPPQSLVPEASAPEPPVPHVVTLTPGTLLSVRIGESLSSARNQPGDSFLTTLDRPLVIDGFVIAEKGSKVEGRVVEAEPAGRARGLAHLGIELVRISTSDGQRIRIRTEPYRKDGPSSSGADAAKIGAGAAIGAAIGAIAGGGKGAGIGAGVGGAAGTADVLLTRGRPADVPVETRLTFRVQEPVTITERLN